MYYAIVVTQDHCSKSAALEKILDSIMLKNSFPFKYIDKSEIDYPALKVIPTVYVLKKHQIIDDISFKEMPNPQEIKQFFKPYL